MNGAESLVRTLLASGVAAVFGPGAGLSGTFRTSRSARAGKTNPAGYWGCVPHPPHPLNASSTAAETATAAVLLRVGRRMPFISPQPMTMWRVM